MLTQSSKILRYSGLFLLPITFLFTAAAQESGPSVDDIVNKNIDARGGIDKLKAIQTIKMTGKFVMGGGQMEAPMTMQIKRPSSLRLDLEIQGQTMVQAFDGMTAWTINPFSGGTEPQKMSADEAGEFTDGADMDGALIGYKEKGHKVTLVGKEDLAGKPVYKLKVDKKSGKTETIYIDATSYLEVKVVAMRRVMGNEMEMETSISDFKPVGGVLMPHSMDSKSGGNAVYAISIEKIEANLPVDDAVFKMPTAK